MLRMEHAFLEKHDIFCAYLLSSYLFGGSTEPKDR